MHASPVQRESPASMQANVKPLQHPPPLCVCSREGSPFCSAAHAVPTCLLQQSAVSAAHGD